MQTDGERTNSQDFTEMRVYSQLVGKHTDRLARLLIRAGLEVYMGKENSQEHLEQIWESERTNHDTDRGNSCTRDNIRLHLNTASSLRLMSVSA